MNTSVHLRSLRISLLGLLSTFAILCRAEISLEKEVKVTDEALFFDGKKVPRGSPNAGEGYDYIFGPALSPHGDCIKTYQQYVFMTWYRGGKQDRHVMLTRYNTETGSLKTIEFPHRHTGHVGMWWLGETHNTIAIGISPKDGSIHLLYDMHAYHAGTTPDGAFANDYFRYSYSLPGAASVSDKAFTLDLFVKSADGDYKHLTMSGVENPDHWGRLTYPKFFLNDEGDLFMYMRRGYDKNGKYVFSRYDGESQWSEPVGFNVQNAKGLGHAYNYGIYGKMTYTGGKIRVAFQQRMEIRDDRYLYQNGIFYAYCDDPKGMSEWKNAYGQPFSLPLVDPDKIKIFEPGDLVESTTKDSILMTSPFDIVVTERGDEHIISRVRDIENEVELNLHGFRKGGKGDFEFTTEFEGGNDLYTSGHYVYLIGLDNGRVFIKQTEGGSNVWSTVYREGASGRDFDKGVAYVSEGKLYYYLKEAGEGDKRSTYLQIIDLGIPMEKEN